MWPYPRVLAHRGGGTLAPENTIAAIKVGLEHGFRGVEFDAMLAADQVPVLMHDPTLERTGLVSGAISELPSSAARAHRCRGLALAALRRRDGADAGANPALLPRP